MASRVVGDHLQLRPRCNDALLGWCEACVVSSNHWHEKRFGASLKERHPSRVARFTHLRQLERRCGPVWPRLASRHNLVSDDGYIVSSKERGFAAYFLGEPVRNNVLHCSLATLPAKDAQDLPRSAHGLTLEAGCQTNRGTGNTAHTRSGHRSLVK